MTDSLKNKRVLITGANGQLGRELQSYPTDSNREIFALNKTEFDISNPEIVQSVISDIQPDLIINTAAYTAVDQAEINIDLAFDINATGPANIAKAISNSETMLIHISTNFVFDGNSQEPYKINDATSPCCVYGKSKLQGEKNLLEIAPDQTAIVRTSWLYSIHGKNFVKTMINLMQQRSTLKVINDQIGTPTWARNLAAAIWKISVNRKDHTIYHYSDNGSASWFDFAQAIYSEGKDCGLINNNLEILPIPTKEFPLPAQRPKYSVLGDKLISPLNSKNYENWQLALQKMLASFVRHLEIE